MPKYNRHFEFEPDQIELIENAMRFQMHSSQDAELRRELCALLGRIHQQKIWFRPKDDPYISG